MSNEKKSVGSDLRNFRVWFNVVYGTIDCETSCICVTAAYSSDAVKKAYGEVYDKLRFFGLDSLFAVRVSRVCFS